MRASRIIARSLLCLPLALSVTACVSASTGTAHPASSPLAPSAGAASSAAPSPTAPVSVDPALAALSADDLLKQSTQALLAADTLTMDVQGVTQSGQTTAHLQIARQAGSCAGATTLAGAPMMTFVSTAQQFWLRPEPAYWSVHPGGAAAKPVKGHYAAGPAGDAKVQGLASLCHVDQALASVLDPAGKATKGDPTTVDGQGAITLNVVGSDGKSSTTVLVAAAGKPYPLQLTQGAERLTFAGFGQPVTIQPPAEGDVVALHDFGQLLG
ncbi:hypothetical protein GCM10009665_77510 [Kitasatospora nipponensis]|uniref:Lipoprotein LprG n=1 Tax=Kitasatospora nipponensis TaxID=258049 RepID=A0ABP4DSY4_9ACTN